MSQADAPAADWYPDPSGRFQFRYWDGDTWTGHVSTDGKTDWDPPGEPGGEAAATAATAEQAQPQSEPEAVAAPQATSDTGGDHEWQPQGAVATAQPSAQPESASDPGSDQSGSDQSGSDQSGFDQGGMIEEGEPSDANLVANQRAGLEEDVRHWLDEVAGQVEPRLSRINTDWTSQPQAEAARACAYGLLVGHLVHKHPHMRAELSLVAESHPSFTTLEADARLDTLEQIAGDAQRSAAWLGPLIGTEDPDRVTMLFD
ncbi:MAG: DUF2510 domain-containing protein [Euzebya sp.]